MRKAQEIRQDKSRWPKLRYNCRQQNLSSFSEGHYIVSCDEVEEQMKDVRQRLQEERALDAELYSILKERRRDAEYFYKQYLEIYIKAKGDQLARNLTEQMLKHFGQQADELELKIKEMQGKDKWIPN